MKPLSKYLWILMASMLLVTACKKDQNEDEQPKETKIIIHTTVAGLGKVAGVHVFLHYYNNPPIEQVTDDTGKVVYENMPPGYYYGSASYDDGNGQEYMIGIPTFRVDEGETVKKDIELQ